MSFSPSDRTRSLAVGYARRSTDRQEQSIPDQRRAIEDFASRRGFHLLRFYIDDAISGTSTTRRKAFQEMLADAQHSPPPFSRIIVYDVKRFGRVDNDEAGYYRHILRTHGVEVLYVSENFSGDGTDDLLRPVKQWQAREESKDLSKVAIRGLLSKAPGGWWMGGAPPYGYDLRYVNDHAPEGEFLFTLRYLPDRTKQVLDERGDVLRTLDAGDRLNISKRDRARLVLSDPERVAVVERIFRMSAEQNKGFRSIAGTLNLEGIPSPRGPEWAAQYHGTWTLSSVRAILVNPIYVGDMVWNRRTDGRFHKISEGRAIERRDMHIKRLADNPESDWIRVQDVHPPIISRRLFDLARRTRESRPTAAVQRGKAHRAGGGENGSRSRFLLSGLIRCARCGGRYEGCRRSKGTPKADGTKLFTFYYGCGNYIRRGKAFCGFGPVNATAIDDAVVRAVTEFYAEYARDGGPDRLARAVHAGLGEESLDLDAARHRAQEERTQIMRTIRNLLDNITAENREFADERIVELRKAKTAIECRLDELRRMAEARVGAKKLTTTAMDSVLELPTALRLGSHAIRLSSLRKVVASIVFDSETRVARVHVQRVPVAELMGQTMELAVTVPKLTAGRRPTDQRSLVEEVARVG
jgi:DNA invertase Pin-like site-specific DNA recombinase